jgi:hypothetical protein
MEDRIKNLSLDQKAKLYYMMLLKKGVIDTLPEDPKAAYVQSMMDKPASSKFSEPMGETNDPEDDAEQAEYDKGWYGESLKEIAAKLGYLKETPVGKAGAGNPAFKINPSKVPGTAAWDKRAGLTVGGDEGTSQYQKVTFIYTEQGGHFYGLDVYVSKDQDQRSDKLKYDEANEWLKGVLEYIHEGDLIPRRYNSGLEDLDLIVARLEELGIEASHGDYMDVS